MSSPFVDAPDDAVVSGSSPFAAPAGIALDVHRGAAHQSGKADGYESIDADTSSWWARRWRWVGALAAVTVALVAAAVIVVVLMRARSAGDGSGVQRDPSDAVIVGSNCTAAALTCDSQTDADSPDPDPCGVCGFHLTYPVGMASARVLVGHTLRVPRVQPAADGAAATASMWITLDLADGCLTVALAPRSVSPPGTEPGTVVVIGSDGHTEYGVQSEPNDAVLCQAVPGAATESVRVQSDSAGAGDLWLQFVHAHVLP